MDTVTARTGHVRELVDRHLERLLERQLGRLAFLDDEDAGLVREHLVAFVLGGGKRLRPEFVYWGYRAGGGERPEEVLPAACAVELVHAAALLLDDIMDEAGARRGRPPAHVALAGLHRAKGLRGDPERFGESVATLLALLALTWADAAILETGTHLPAALDHLTRLRVEAIGGQYLDLTRTFTAGAPATRPSATLPPGTRADEEAGEHGGGDAAAETGGKAAGQGRAGERGAGQEDDGTAEEEQGRAGGQGVGQQGGGTAEEEQARLISLYKSGKYTVERPLLLGHAVAGGSAPTRRLLRAYALPLGEAFQLRDDVNGVFGDPAVTGKPAGADLLQGKATYLLAEARRLTGGAPALDAITGPEGVAEARRLIVECGALDAAERRIADLVAEAIAALDHPPGLPPDARRALTHLATTTTQPPDAPAPQAGPAAAPGRATGRPAAPTPGHGGGDATKPSAGAASDTGADAPSGPAGRAEPGAGTDAPSGPAAGAGPADARAVARAETAASSWAGTEPGAGLAAGAPARVGAGAGSRPIAGGDPEERDVVESRTDRTGRPGAWAERPGR
ncbi:polyprenyl synthetase family protein [Nonomuraea fastidiosa]|uniref:polyprenyl synthetase family protein n=1 Tax=Nonomuraea fastidiosa TaxID=46173 RepID=UPI00366AB8DF